jgi:hypothetical protein
MSRQNMLLIVLTAIAFLAVSVAAAPSHGWPEGELRFVPRDESKPFFRRQANNTVVNGSYNLIFACKFNA